MDQKRGGFSKEQEFVLMVQTAAIMAAVRIEIEAKDKPPWTQTVLSPALSVSLAVSAASRIPAELSAFQAAVEFISHHVAPGRDLNERPPEWIGTESEAEALAQLGPDEEIRNGKVYLDDPELVGLDFEDHDVTKALNLIRRQDATSSAELQKLLPHCDRYRVKRLMHKARRQGFVVDVGRSHAMRWVPTQKLLDTLPEKDRLALQTPQPSDAPPPPLPLPPPPPRRGRRAEPPKPNPEPPKPGRKRFSWE